jgi:hypothetical protein
MRLVLLLLLAVLPLFSQVCPPVRILPTGVVSGILDDSSCFLSDSTAYASYRLDLPVRGRIRLTLTTTEDFGLILRDSSGAKIGSGASIARAVEAGAYTVLVNARVPGQTGQYGVRAEFTPEAGALCNAFPSLGLTQKVDGALGVSGCTLPDGAAYEAYWLNTFGAGTLTLNVTADWSPAIFIRTPDGALVASGDSTVTAVLAGDSQYQIVISTTDRAGAYQLTTAFTAADEETCRPTKTLAGPDTDNGVIDAASCATTTSGSGDLSFYNYYAVVIPAAGIADFTVTSSDFGATVNLIDESGNLIASDAGGGDSGGAQLRLQLRPGKYLAQIFSSVASGGSYRFSYALTPGAPRPCPTTAIEIADGRSAKLSSESCRTELGLADIYAITLPGPGTLDLTVAPSSFLSGTVAVRDTKDNLIVMSRDVQDLGLSNLNADLPAGSYTVAVVAGSGSGFYQLAGRFAAHDIPPCSVVQTLDINGGYIQRLGAAGCHAPNGAPVDYYEFTLPSEAVTAMIMTSSNVDGYLTLTDSTGAVLRSDDNSYGLGDPLMIQHLAAGTYRLAARPASGTLGGLYQIDVRTILGSRPPFCAPKSTIPVGSTVTGTINFGSCQYTDNTFADIYKFELTADSTTLDIRLNSSAFDAYLLLLDAKGNLVDRDDDTGGNRNARLQPTLAVGTYYLVAKPSADYTAGGAYTLAIQ